MVAVVPSPYVTPLEYIEQENTEEDIPSSLLNAI